MRQIEDSIARNEASIDGLQQVIKAQQPLTPAQVLSKLPKDATPEQQDSAIQAQIKPSEITWSNRPDTLHLPGQSPGKSWRDVTLPKYYKESFFSQSPLFHPEQPGGRIGFAGDPIPYTLAGDNVVTSILIGCFMLGAIAFTRSKDFITRQTKNFFHIQRAGTTEISETASELRLQFFLMLQTSLQLALLYFLYIKATVSDTFIVEQYQVIGCFAAVIFAYFILKIPLYSLVNATFFDKKKTQQWLKSYLVLTSVEGLLIYPAILLVTYFDFQLEYAMSYTLSIIALGKLLSFYKTYLIFFKQNGNFLQNILYFCALETMPLIGLWGFLVMISSFLKINF